jgi:hypothetical protein
MPEEISEYVTAAHDAEMSPDEFVKHFEGTYNTDNGHFTCTQCYLEMGAPSTRYGWRAP